MQTFILPNIEPHSYSFLMFYIDFYRSIKLPEKIFAVTFIFIDLKYFVPIKYLALAGLIYWLEMPRINLDGTIYKPDIIQSKENLCRTLSFLKCFKLGGK
jgi:hypothetical protein